MISLKEQVCAALHGVCAEVVYARPDDFMGREWISWRESANRCHARADGAEYLAELQYSLDIFAQTPERAGELLAAADARLHDAGLRRAGSALLSDAESGLYHANARYRALADANGRIYQ